MEILHRVLFFQLVPDESTETDPPDDQFGTVAHHGDAAGQSAHFGYALRLGHPKVVLDNRTVWEGVRL